MSNVIQLRADDEARKLERRLTTRFGIKTAQLHVAIRPLFLLMHDHDIGNVSITCDGTKALVTVDGESL